MQLVFYLLCFISKLASSNAEGSSNTSSSGHSKVCYKDYGCYSMEYPYVSTPERLLPVPLHPAKLNAFVDYYSRQYINEPITIPLYGNISLKNADFNASRPLTVFIISGFGTYANWQIDLKDAILERMDANVFYVNTTEAGKGLAQYKAASNIRVVSVQLARFIKYLQVHYKLRPEIHVWLIGYDLGAHLAGYTGKRVPVARITGLDPTQIFFDGYPSEVRLDRTDAKFVDVIHTNAEPYIPHFGFGVVNPIGHVDIYVNSGSRQPGCKDFGFRNLIPSSYAWKQITAHFCQIDPTTILRPEVLIPALFKLFLEFVKQMSAVGISSWCCNHKRSFKYFIQSIKNKECVIWGHPVSMEFYSQGRSNGESGGELVYVNAIRDRCTAESCVPMGLYTSRSNLRGVFIATTSSHAPWCSRSDQNIPTREQSFLDVITNTLLGVAGL